MNAVSGAKYRFLVVILLLALTIPTGCKSASDTNLAPLITAIKVLQGSTELLQLARDADVTLRVEYTDEDYSWDGSGDKRFEPDIVWAVKFDGTTNYITDGFVDPTTNPTTFKVPDQPGTLRIEITLTDRYDEIATGHKLIEIHENTAPVIRDFTVGGLISNGLIPQAKRMEPLEIEVEYIDDDYDPDGQDPDPLKRPEFLWSAEWNDTGADLNDGFFDSSVNPCLFETPDVTGYIKLTVVITDRDDESAEESLIIEISDNEPVEITSLNIGAVLFHVSTERTMSVSASDPDDSGGTLTYEWGADGGQFTTLTNLSEVKWSASSVGTYNIYVRVTDEDGGWDREDFVLEATNEAPEITGFDIGEKNPAPGEIVNIDIYVTDPDSEDANEDLIYEWSADGGGFASETVTEGGAQAEWLAPQDTGSYVLSVTVRDGWGGMDSITLPPITVETGG